MVEDNGCFDNLAWFFSWLWLTPKYKKQVSVLTQDDLKETKLENSHQIDMNKYRNKNDIITERLNKVKEFITLCDTKIETEEKNMKVLRDKAKRFKKQGNDKDAKKALIESKLFEKKIEILEKQKKNLNELYQKYDLTAFSVTVFQTQQNIVKSMGTLNTKKIIDESEKLQEDVTDLDSELKQLLNISNFKTDELDEEELDNELNNLVHEREDVVIDMSDVVIPKSNVDPNNKEKETEAELVNFEKELLT